MLKKGEDLLGVLLSLSGYLVMQNLKALLNQSS